MNAAAAKTERITFTDMRALVLARIDDLEIWCAELAKSANPRMQDVRAGKLRELAINRRIDTLIECVMADREIMRRLTERRP